MRYRSCRLSRSESCCGGPKRSWTAWFPSLIRSAWQVLCGCAAARWPPGGPGPSQPTARPPGLAGSSPFPIPPVRSGHTWPPPGPKPKAASAAAECLPAGLAGVGEVQVLDHDGPALTRSGEPDDGGNRRPQPAITGAGRQPVKVQGDRRRLAARACGAGNRLAQLGKPVATTAHRHPTGGQPPLNLTQLAAQLLQAALLLQPLRLTFIPPYPGAAMTLRLPHED